MILVSDSIYDLLQTKIMQTPYKKRKNFKFYLTDKWGVRSKVVYKNEKLYNCSLIHKDWCEITSPSSEPGFERFEPCSALGASICALHKIKQTNPEIDTDYYHDQCMKKIQDQNHTGNHYRQQYITERKSQPIYGQIYITLYIFYILCYIFFIFYQYIFNLDGVHSKPKKNDFF